MPQRKSFKNFGRNVTLSPTEVHRPESEEELLEILRRSDGKQIRAIGKLHCWSEAIEADQILILMDRLNSISIINQNDSPIVTVGGGCLVKELLDELAKQQLTLPSIGLIDEQTVAGATATGTHGSGKNSLSHYIVSVRIAHFDNAGNPVITVVDSGPELQAARCSLGLLGIVVSLTFECREQYRICEHAAKYDAIEAVVQQESRYPQQQFYLMPWTWKYFAHHRFESEEPKSKTAGFYRIYCFAVIDISLHIVVLALSKLLSVHAFARFFYKWMIGLTIPLHWKVVDDARKMLVMEHDMFRHIEIELFVTRSQLFEAAEFVIDVLSGFGGQTCPSKNQSIERLLQSDRGAYCHRYPICFRRVLPDDTLISMTSPDVRHANDDWYAISLISYEWPNRRGGFFKMAKFIADQMKHRFNARCHWGKHNPLTIEDNLQLYPRLKQFNSIRKKFDAEDRFANRWLSQVICDEKLSSQDSVLNTQATSV